MQEGDFSSFWKTVFFPTQAAALCQSVLEVNYAQLWFKIPLPANLSQPLSVQSSGCRNQTRLRLELPRTYTSILER